MSAKHTQNGSIFYHWNPCHFTSFEMGLIFIQCEWYYRLDTQNIIFLKYLLCKKKFEVFFENFTFLQSFLHIQCLFWCFERWRSLSSHTKSPEIWGLFPILVSLHGVTNVSCTNLFEFFLNPLRFMVSVDNYFSSRH